MKNWLCIVIIISILFNVYLYRKSERIEQTYQTAWIDLGKAVIEAFENMNDPKIQRAANTERKIYSLHLGKVTVDVIEKGKDITVEYNRK